MFIFRDKDKGNQWSLMVNRNSRAIPTTDLKLWNEIATTNQEEYKDKKPEELNAAAYEAYNDALANMQHVFGNNGVDLEGNYHSVTDMYSVPDAPMLLPEVVSTVVREAAEPLLIGASLLERIQYTPGTTKVLTPHYGALTAGDIAEGAEYPESSLDMGGNQEYAQIGKSGLAVKITEEMIRYSQFDIMGLHLRAAGKALARWKETKIFNMITQEGQVYIDNKSPQSAILGASSGRNFHGSQNGSVTTDDIFDIWGSILANGYNADTMLLNPLTWTMTLRDADMRAFAMQAGGVIYGSYTGSPQGGLPWASTLNGRGSASGYVVGKGTPQSEVNQQQTGAPQFPSFLGVPFRIIVSPFVDFRHDDQTTDIMVFDSGNLGYMMVDEEPTTEEWNDPARDIMKVKIRERYSLGMLEEGLAAGVMKNIVNTSNEISLMPAQKTIDVAALDHDGAPATGIQPLEKRSPIA